nr:transcription factor Adf-1-like [Misgurnus anguillicaudatus]
MDEKLILCVSEFPELYNTSLRSYRDIGRKAVSWKHVANQVGMSEDECKRRWKNLRDRYIKERKTMKEKKSGAGAEQKTKWRYFSIMSFLEPHVRDRATSSNMSPSLEERSSSPHALQVTLSPLTAQSSPPGTPTETFTITLTDVSPSSLSTPAVLATESSETLSLSDPPSVTEDAPSTSAPHVPSTTQATPASQRSIK